MVAVHPDSCFDGDRDGAVFDDAVQNFHCQMWILHQGGASPPFGHFFDRAAHVDINQIRLKGAENGRCLPHYSRICSKKLKRDWPFRRI